MLRHMTLNTTFHPPSSEVSTALVMNSTTPSLGRPQSESRAWFEPLIVVAIMVSSLIINRHRNFYIFQKKRHVAYERSHSADSLLSQPDWDSYEESTSKVQRNEKSMRIGQRQTILGISLDTSRFAEHLHSRMLQKYPFLIEMFYWALNYVFYIMTKKISSHMYLLQGSHEVTELAQKHALDILSFEHDSIFRCFFPFTEVGAQKYFLENHQSILTAFNQLYSLVHIPGTVAFLSWYYFVAPNHNSFAIVRRTMTLGNFAAFLVFSFYPCMPPRLLPKSYGFQDTVRQENAESVWTKSNNVNQLAAMPSLHFTYAFIIGCTFLHHSGIVPALLSKARRQSRLSALTGAFYAVVAIAYPLLVLLIIVATANHFWLDAVVATGSITLSYFCNRVWLLLQPLELALQLVLRVEKPIPTTGLHRRLDARAEGRGRAPSLA